MGRPKCFERDDALARAMQCFCTRGYEATSLDDLVRETGVGRQSLYNEFGDKHSIYLAALERFAEVEGKKLVALLDSAPHVRSAIAALLAHVVDQSTKQREMGCLLTSASVELANADVDVRKIVTASNGFVVRLLEARLRDAQVSGEIAPHHDPAALARFFVAQLAAIRVTAQTVHDRKILDGIARVALGVLG
jgi:TetR/AcrR family transcriptional repressor of nem operon